MSNLEMMLSENEENLQKSVVKYYNHFKQAFISEPIKHIYIQQNFYPDALIITNKRLFLGSQKNLGATIELNLEIPLIEIVKFGITEGMMTDDFLIWIGKSSVCYTFSGFPKKTSFLLKRYLENIVTINERIWSKLPNQEYD